MQTITFKCFDIVCFKKITTSPSRKKNENLKDFDVNKQQQQNANNILSTLLKFKSFEWRFDSSLITACLHIFLLSKYHIHVLF